MNYPKAGVTDLIRKHQKDEQFIERYNNSLVDFLRLTTNSNEGKLRKYSSYLSQLSYYTLTSLSNLQTLGEEYTTIIRFQDSIKNIPTRFVQLLWLILHVFGRDIFLQTLNLLKTKVLSQPFQPSSKETLINLLNFLKEKESTLARLHTAIFYVQSKYYEIASRLTGVQFVSWSKNEDFHRPFQILGTVSIVYLVLNICYDMYTTRLKVAFENNYSNDNGLAAKSCFLCGDERIYATLLSCGHYFCWNCAFNVARYQRKCPICREGVDANSLILLENY